MEEEPVPPPLQQQESKKKTGADEAARLQQFKHFAYSSLVLNQETRSRARAAEPTGEAETLWGRIDPHTFGDRALASTKPRSKKPSASTPTAVQAPKHAVAKKKKTVMDASDDADLLGTMYRPRTRETQAAYEALLEVVQRFLGDQPRDVVRGAADEIMGAAAKDTKLAPAERCAAFARVLGVPAQSLPQESVADILAISASTTEERSGGEIDEETGVAVVFDRDDEERKRLVQQQRDEDEEVVEPDADEEDQAEDGEEASMTAQITGVEEMGGGTEEEMATEEEKIDARKIDAYWLQRKVHETEPDAVAAQTLADKALTAMTEAGDDDRAAENALVFLLGYERFALVKLLLRHRRTILWCTRLAMSEGEEARKVVIAEIAAAGAAGRKVLRELGIETQMQPDEVKEATIPQRKAKPAVLAADISVTGRRVIDLESLSFQQGGHTMSNKACKLPPGSFRTAKKGYDEIHVPRQRLPQLDETQLVPIESMDAWTRPMFPEGVKRLNYVQSRIYQTAYFTPDNILISAPTSSGKTICAMLCMLHEIGLHRNGDNDDVDRDAIKIVYIAPMKSLVQEMAGNFSKRFEPLGLVVRELSGDASLTKHQMAETQIIVTTPEKWDIVTRKADGSGHAAARLVIIDEVHLLHDTRGPVLEAIVARTLRQVEQSQEHVRLVGLSATLPNYEDVATFLRVEKKNVFAFDNSYRPVPLEQTYIGVGEKKALRRMQLMNEITYELVAERAGKHQVLIFVHSRKETAKTARYLRDAAVTAGIMNRFVREDAASREVLQTEAAEIIDAELRDLLPHGFAVHHAGLSKGDRRLVEDLFADGHLQVLVSTSTLAWGVNLPCHTVIIKGTQIYSPEMGRWTELSPLDVMQMVGRAGRPQYDTEGEGILITSHGELQYYLSLLNQQLPIESQLVSRLPDMLNAEITLGTIQSMKEAVTWLAYTYLYVRMLRNPVLYGVPESAVTDDPLLEQYRSDLIHSAAALLERGGLIKYDRRAGTLQSTDLGRVASHYYVTFQSMAVYGEHLRPTMTDVELFRLFSLSNEFKLIPVRAEEKPELERLATRVPIPVKESIDEPSAKVNVLLQAYISRLRLEGFALASDMVYVTQSAGRIARALFEIAMRRGWAQLAQRTLTLSAMIERRLWQSQTPLRQFSTLTDDIARRVERQDHCTFEHMYELSSQELGTLIHMPERGKSLWRLVHAFPRLELAASVQPLTRAMLLIDLVATPDFAFDATLLGSESIGFWVFVEDVDGEQLLHSEYLLIKKRYAGDDHALSFTVPISEPLPPHYFVRVVADRWLGSEIVIPLSFRRLVLPEKFPPLTELLDLAPLPVAAALKSPEFAGLYNGRFTSFNSVQTQVFPSVFGGDENVLVCAPPASGHTVLAELAILRSFTTAPSGERARAVCIVPMQAACDRRLRMWREMFSSKAVNGLTGDTASDLRTLDTSDLVVTTPQLWDQLSRRWRQRKPVTAVRLFVVDDLHLVGSGANGATLEFIVSRMRFIASQQQQGGARIVGLATSVANARDIGEWIGATPKTTFGFAPGARPVPLECHIQGFESADHSARMAAMARPVLQAVQRHGAGHPTIIFVPSKREAYSIARELALFADPDDPTRTFLQVPVADIEEHCRNAVRGQVQLELLASGIGVLHEGVDAAERGCIERLFASGAISLLIGTHEQAWTTEGLGAHLVIVMGTESYDGREHRYADYPVAELLEMTSRACVVSSGSACKCVVLCAAPRKEFLKRFLFEALPVESHADRFLHDHLNAEITVRTVTSKQDAVDYLTWTLAYRRLPQNPNYYAMAGNTHRHISDKLSELVESTLTTLETARCVAIDGMDVSPLNLGIVASYYGISYATVELFSTSLTERTKLRGLVEILTAAVEFDDLPVRHHEETILRRIAQHLPIRVRSITTTSATDTAEVSLKDPHAKANVLLQAHMLRRALPSELAADQAHVVERIPRLIQALVDVASSCSWLAPAIAAMELAQFVTQAMWETDPTLRQLPHLGEAALKRLADKHVESVFDLAEMDDASRKEALGDLNPRQLRDVATFCNDFPNLDVSFQSPTETIAAGDQVAVTVILDHSAVPPQPAVHAPFFPRADKAEEWWVVVGSQKRNQLASIKRVGFARQLRQELRLEFPAPAEPGKHDFMLTIMCDSYLGCDQEYPFILNVIEAAADTKTQPMETSS